MVKHIVLYNAKDGKEVYLKSQYEQMKEALTSLVGKIDGLLKVEVSVTYNETSHDICLYTEFTDRAALEAYRVNPHHLEAAQFVRSVTKDRVSADYEV
ncbi:MAG: Dabb family protein [Oscillospiraceae bacterium]|nr:Dabb family protein [Oscillospiraceae bacterium]